MNWDDAVNAVKETEMDSVIRGKIVGMSFVPGYPNNLYRLFEARPAEAIVKSNVTAVIKRNPENAYDSNACEVHVGGQIVGHLPRELAAEVAPMLDAGGTHTMEVDLLVMPGKESNPGLSFKLTIEP